MAAGFQQGAAPGLCGEPLSSHPIENPLPYWFPVPFAEANRKESLWPLCHYKLIQSQGRGEASLLLSALRFGLDRQVRWTPNADRSRRPPHLPDKRSIEYQQQDGRHEEPVVLMHQGKLAQDVCIGHLADPLSHDATNPAGPQLHLTFPSLPNRAPGTLVPADNDIIAYKYLCWNEVER